MATTCWRRCPRTPQPRSASGSRTTGSTNLTDSFAGLGLGDGDDLISQVEAETGLAIPEDLQTLVGDSVAVSLGSDIDPQAIEGSDPGDVPVGVKIKGDADAIHDVIDKLLGSAGAPDEVRDLFGYDGGGDFAVLGPDADYRDQLLEDGGLGDSDVYRPWSRSPRTPRRCSTSTSTPTTGCVRMAQGFGPDDEIAANLEPLGALGISAWVDGDASHALVRLTTD